MENYKIELTISQQFAKKSHRNPTNKQATGHYSTCIISGTVCENCNNMELMQKHYCATIFKNFKVRLTQEQCIYHLQSAVGNEALYLEP